ncbi:Ig-like domain-containing protein [Acetanaerobacterium elongatum]|uniref:Ig-like domain-containing protein n=1 Tax=Acetanaerobacterium elongatum TaxID=258515 RepID=UPI003BFA66DC
MPVFSTGAVVAVGAGTAKVTAKAGSYSASCTFTVTKKIPVTGITISKSTWVLNASDSTELSAYITPTNATNKAITWSSSIKPNGRIIKGLLILKSLVIQGFSALYAANPGPKRAGVYCIN